MVIQWFNSWESGNLVSIPQGWQSVYDRGLADEMVSNCCWENDDVVHLEVTHRLLRIDPNFQRNIQVSSEDVKGNLVVKWPSSPLLGIENPCNLFPPNGWGIGVYIYICDVHLRKIIRCCSPIYFHLELQTYETIDKNECMWLCVCEHEDPPNSKDNSRQEPLMSTDCWWLKSCNTWDVWNLINNGINYLSTGAGFQPSTGCHLWSAEHLSRCLPMVSHITRHIPKVHSTTKSCW